jgi:glycosyltransferase involved in cell wall biosynthesis
LKIIHIIPNLKKGGAERLAIDICSQLNRIQNIQVVLIYLENLNFYENQTENLNVKFIESTVVPSITSKNQIQVSALRDFIENFKPDVIHTHLFKAEIVSRYFFYDKAKWFTHTHDNMVQLQNWSWKNIFKKISITNFYEKQNLFNLYKKNGGTHFIAISKHTESYIKSIQSKYPVTLIHNAIDVKRFQKPTGYIESIQNNRLSSVEVNYSQFSSSQVENQPSVPIAIGTTINLINIGSFLLKKNQSFLLDIIVEFKKREISVSCFFLGDGPYKKEVQNKASDLDISNQCFFLGNVENVEEYLWQSDVYVHTATYEPLGLVLIEAMAAGLPVISLDGGGNRDLMINGKNGYLIEKQDTNEFANRILEVFQNKEISDFNTEFAKQFDIDSYCEKLLEIYQSYAFLQLQFIIKDH